VSARILANEFIRNLILLYRYPVQTVSIVITVALLFYGIFLGASFMAGPGAIFGEQLDAIIIGYLLWSMSIFVLSTFAWELEQEAVTGTLEHLYLSPYGPVSIIGARAVSSLFTTLLINALILGSILLLTGRTLSLNALAFGPLIAALIAMHGFGYMLGSLSLRFKRIGQAMQIIQFPMLILLVAPFEQWEGLARYAGYFLPVVPAAGQLRQLVAFGGSLDPAMMLIAFANGVAYLALGIALFRLADRWVRRAGMVGHY
jgi:ABC-2 type transport system permease protein